ncbi:MAG: nucleotide-binding protein [Bacteroidia bacterium]|nr:nucleotide-binding protein [Bacteroidia bacterium]
MPSSAQFPKIAIISSDTTGKFTQTIASLLESQDLQPSINEFHLFLDNTFQIDFFLSKAKELDFCIFIVRNEDIDKLNSHANPKLLFALGLIIGILSIERVILAKPKDEELGLFSELKTLDTVPLNLNITELKKSFRVLSNKMGRKINQMGIREKSLFRKDPEGIVDLFTHYIIKIENQDGDGSITRMIQLEAKHDNVGSREHRIFSDTSTSSYEALKLKAWDKYNKELATDIIYDAPNQKDFKIFFRNQLSKGEKLTYTYTCHWEGMFPKKKSHFTLKNTAKKIRFDLILPKAWDLLLVSVKEKRRDGVPSKKVASIKLLDEAVEGDFKRYSYRLEEFGSAVMETQVFWKYKLASKKV